MTNVRDIDCSNAPAALRSVLLYEPKSHPVWHFYQVSLVHLRHMDGMRAPVLIHPDSTHEIGIFALDPDSSPDPTDPSTISRLGPPNLAHQLRGRTDAGARDLFQAFVTALGAGTLSPDSDFRSHLIGWLDHWGKAS